MTPAFVPWICGLDIAQLSDYSALAIVQRHVMGWGNVQEQRYQVRHLERFALGTSYPKLVEKVCERLAKLPKPFQWDEHQSSAVMQPHERWTTWLVRKHYDLVVDVTGVGRPIADMFEAVREWPIKVTITHGNTVTEADRDEWHVAKRLLVSSLQVPLQQGRIQVAASLPEARTLLKEAQNFQYKLSEKSGEDTYGAWREGQHDDLLLALAVAIWFGETHAPPRQVVQQQQFAKRTSNPLVAGRNHGHAR